MERETSQETRKLALKAKLRGVWGQMQNLESWADNKDKIVQNYYRKFLANSEAKIKFEDLKQKLSQYFDQSGSFISEVDEELAQKLFNEWDEVLKTIENK